MSYDYPDDENVWFSFETDDGDSESTDLYECRCGRRAECMNCGEDFCGRDNGFVICYDHDVQMGLCGKCFRNGYRIDKCQYCQDGGSDHSE